MSTKRNISHDDFIAIVTCKRFIVANAILSFIFTLIFIIIFSVLSNYGKVSFQPSDLGNPISIANTYIVFTTLFFVIFSAVITFAGIWFSNQFSKQKEEQINSTLNEIISKFGKSNDDNSKSLAESLIQTALDSTEGKRFFDEKLATALSLASKEIAKKIDETIKAKKDASQEQIAIAESEAAALEAFSRVTEVK